MKIIMLGTGHAMTTKCFNTCFLIEDKNEYFLIDTGGGNQILSIFENLNIEISKIKNIFITHKHLDHLNGIFWIIRKILSTYRNKKTDYKLNIFSHKEVLDIMNSFLNDIFSKKDLSETKRLTNFIEIKDKDSIKWNDNEFTFFDINASKAKQFGFELKFLNKRITCLGDEPFNESSIKYVKNCDYLMCEAFCTDKEKDIFKPHEKHHSTVKDVCLNLKDMNVKNLILYHCDDTNLKDRKIKFLNEAKSYFSGRIFVPYDLEIIEIK